MMRRNFYFLALVATSLTLGAGDAFADRLGAAYRGPEDNKATDTGTDTATDAGEAEGPDTTGPEAGGGDDGGGGLSEGGGETGGSEGGSEPPPEGGEGGGSSSEGGGSSLGGGGESGGGASAGGAQPSGGGGDLGGGGAAGGRGRSGSNAQQAFQRVMWYFEHNREQYVYDVAARQASRVVAPRYSSIDVLGVSPRDVRVRAQISATDRDVIFDLLQKNAKRGNVAIVRDAAVLALGKMGSDAAVDVLIERFTAEPSIEVKQDILLALGQSRSDRALETLSKALGDRHLQSFALMGLGLTGDSEKAGAVVLQFFKKNSRSTKGKVDALCSAAVAMGALRYEPAVADLAAVAKSKKTPTVLQVYCTHALGSIGDDKAMKSLQDLFKKSDLEVSRAAALALGASDDPKVLSVLEGKGGLGKADPLVSGFAAISMAEIMSRVPETEHRKYPEALREVAVKPEKDSVKAQYAHLALAMFGGGFDNDLRKYYQEQFAESKLSEDVRSALIMSAGVAGIDSHLPTLLEMAGNRGQDPKARSYAAMSAGMLGAASDSSRTAEALKKIYAETDDPDVRRGAIFGMGLVGDRDDVPFLIDALKAKEDNWLSEYTRGAAVVAIGMIRDSDSIGKLQGLLGHPDERTRAYALAALGYLADKDQVPTMPKLFKRNNFRQEFDTLRVVMGNL